MVKYDPKDKENSVYFRQILNKIFVEKTLLDEFGNFVKVERYGNISSAIKVYKTVKKEVHKVNFNGCKKIGRGLFTDFDLYCVDEGTSDEFYYEVGGEYIPSADDARTVYVTRSLKVYLNEGLYYSLGDIVMSSFMSPYADTLSLEEEYINEDFWMPIF